MESRDPRIDAYITKSADFAKPILTHIRNTVHTAAPEVQETIKWGFPHFMYAGSILCSMAAFKHHCALHFWNGSLVTEKAPSGDKNGMGQFGRVATIGDLPSKTVLNRYIKRAMRLKEQGVKSPTRSKPKTKRPALASPPALVAALRKNRKAQFTFESLSPSHQREYVEWITEAKTDATRDRRIATTTEWLTEGKSLNWKYERT